MLTAFQETDDLILVNIDNGSVSTSTSETVDLPQIPLGASDCFTQRCRLLHHHISALLHVFTTWLWMVQVRFPGDPL